MDVDGIYFDAASVQLDIAFIESLTLTKSTKSGKPEPFTLLPVHKKLVSNLLGWKRPDGSRLYRRCYFSTGRKQAKTQIAAGIALDLLVMGEDSQPEIYVAALDREQASRCFEAARDMVYASPELNALLRVVEYQKTIINPANGGVLKALSSEGKSKHGSNPSAVIFDELHAWGTAEQELYDALRTGSNARREPLFLTITTAGVDEHSICGREYQYACNVRDGIVQDPTFLPQIYELAKDDAWDDERNWIKANPTLGQITRVEELRQWRDLALNVPSEQTAFRRLYCNQWVNAKDIWIPLHHFDGCKWDGMTALPR